ncbi:enoyl-CoA hydratase-related protein [Reyranella sp. CPCC 100927]|uniref:enoyl-CoA hydratase-related protein n=1 Tax=Reyranella sp. CPCC 100927 TaxID=2599616 RepID=UPI0015B69A0E|nr:enoyl-CoA hydratase-related protein [Reyranella sp. CPCC 100927]
MTYETLLLERDGPLATLTLNRPTRLNAMSGVMAQELPAAMNQLLGDDGVRAILLTGAGRGFCAGADLKDMHARNQDGTARAQGGDNLRKTVNPMLLRMAAAPKPIIAAVNGPAAGFGCGLALAADIVLAARSANFLQAFVRLGVVPDGGSSWLLPRLIGRSRSSAMMLLGEKIPAETAAQWGLIHQVLDDDALMPAARALALKMANGPTLAYAAIKRMIQVSTTNDFAAQLALEAGNQDAAFETADFREGVAAFNEGREAKFAGR